LLQVVGWGQLGCSVWPLDADCWHSQDQGQEGQMESTWISERWWLGGSGYWSVQWGWYWIGKRVGGGFNHDNQLVGGHCLLVDVDAFGVHHKLCHQVEHKLGVQHSQWYIGCSQ